MKASVVRLVAGAVVCAGLAGTAPAQPIGTARGVSPAVLKRVDQESEATLLRLYTLSPRAHALVDRAVGVLVVPALRADGGILGVAYGRGVLIDAVGQRTYYNVIASPPGSVLGLDGKGVVLVFSSRESLRAFLSTPGWVEGVNGSIAILDETVMAGHHAAVSAPIAGFILSARGLASGLTLAGSFFIKVPVLVCLDASATCGGGAR